MHNPVEESERLGEAVADDLFPDEHRESVGLDLHDLVVGVGHVGTDAPPLGLDRRLHALVVGTVRADEAEGAAV